MNCTSSWGLYTMPGDVSYVPCITMYVYTYSWAPSHEPQSCDKKGSAMPLEKELQIEAVRHFTDLKTSLKRAHWGKLYSQGESCGLNACVTTGHHGLMGGYNNLQNYFQVEILLQKNPPKIKSTEASPGEHCLIQHSNVMFCLPHYFYFYLHNADSKNQEAALQKTIWILCHLISGMQLFLLYHFLQSPLLMLHQ